MNRPCDCCEGTHILTPRATANRPGLSRLVYRVGSHATFFETMQARLSSQDYPELAALKTREKSDPSIALLDAWATVADVLTFYQERIANEGYLHTATERRSILELARLIGYALRPGVSASVYLAYSIEKDATPVEIPKGARANSIPAPGEQMQAFETAEPLKTRFEWNDLKPRMTQPQTAVSIKQNGLYLQGTATNLKINDALLIVFKTGEDGQPFRVYDVKTDDKADRTLVTLREWDGSSLALATIKESASGATILSSDSSKTVERSWFGGLLDKLQLPPSIPPSSSRQLAKAVQNTFAARADIFPKLLTALLPRLEGVLYPALGNTEVSQKQEIKVYAMRVRASLFGHNAPPQPVFDDGKVTSYTNPHLSNMWGGLVSGLTTLPVIALDASYDKIQPDSFVIIDRPVVVADGSVKDSNTQPAAATRVFTIHTASTSQAATMSGLGVSAKVTQLGVSLSWDVESTMLVSTPLLRETVVYAESEQLVLANEPIDNPVCDDTIDLDALYDGLESGRWLIVSGERTDVQGKSGIKASELVMLAGVTQTIKPITEALKGDKLHTFIKFAEPLTYCYKRDTVAIYGNVVKATHGETRQEVLGSGDAAKALQTFILKQPPLTYVSAPTVSGVQSTLEARVNDVQWHEAESIAALGPNDRKFVTRNDDDAKTMVTFGNGERGARLPTGQENVKATYRNGIGKPGNVKAGQISLLSTRPLGVKGVINPIRASGGADKEGRDQARKNAPLAVMALDRLVSTQDYADFARTFAGIGKAAAVRLTDGRRQLVHVTIAGADDIPIETTSDLYRNLRDALHRFGDPYLPIRIEVRERLALVISAKVRIHPDYQWETLEPKIRAAVLDTFGFENVELGDDLLISNAIKIIQSIRGITYVDVDVFDKISEAQLLDGFTGSAASKLKLNHRIMVEPAHVDKVDKHEIKAAQLAYLTPEVPDTLILQEIKP